MQVKPKKIETKQLPKVVLEKWRETILDEGYVPFPKRLIRSLSKVFVGPHGLDDLAVVLAIVDYRRPNLVRPPSVEYLSCISGLTIEKFKERIIDLQRRGYVVASGSDDAVRIEIDGVLSAIVKESSDEVWPTSAPVNM